MMNQEQHHAYDARGNYHGIVVATADELAAAGLVSGNPPAPDLVALKKSATDTVISEHAKMLETLSGGYTSAERDTWTLQLEWARGYLADQNAAHEALLAGMVPASMATTAAADARMMADKIVAKANEYARLTMLAQRTKTEALASVAAAATPADLEAVMAALKDIVASAITELNQPV